MGGPLVKIKRLNFFFPEYLWNYNLAYLISNAPYLGRNTLIDLKYKNVPIVLNQNGVFYSGWYSGDWEKQNKIMSYAYHEADYVFWQSNFCKLSANKFLGKRKGNGEILYNAVNLNLFFPKKNLNQEYFKFLITGKISKHLNYRLESSIMGLSLARKKGLNATLIIAGLIEDKNYIYDLSKRYGLSKFIKYIGTYSQEEAPKIYQSADAYIITKYLDPCPNTVIEAMACGLPILYSNSGGIPELVGKKAGVPINVPQEWDKIHTPSAETISEGMIKIFNQKITMSSNARIRAEKYFGMNNWIEKHNNVFLKLLKR